MRRVFGFDASFAWLGLAVFGAEAWFGRIAFFVLQWNRRVQSAAVDGFFVSLHGARKRMNVRLVHAFRFEAAHRLPKVAEGHKCARLHGHSYLVELALFGPVNEETGWLVDFAEIEEAWQPLHELLDHQYLNDVPGLENPTSEVLAGFIWRRLKAALPWLCRVTVFETPDARCEYEGA